MGNQTSGYFYPEETIENKENDLIVTSLPEDENNPTEPFITDNVESPEPYINEEETPLYIKTRSKDFCIIKYTFETDEEDIINEHEISEMDIPDEDDRVTPLFTSLDEIKLLKTSITQLEKSINKKIKIINELTNKEDDYIDELDELFIENQRLTYKLNSRRYEPFAFSVRNSFPQRRHSDNL